MNANLKAAIDSDFEINRIWDKVGIAGYRGSIAHGTSGDVIDDIDILGVFIAPENHYFGLGHIECIERVCVNDEYDFCLYELRKFIRLLLKSNPNVLSLLWVPENLYIVRNEWGKRLLANRNIFLSKQLYKSFGGYAFGQLKRMSHPCTNQAYQGAKRRERFEKFGYDCKNAAHLIRLLKMGIEVLSTGEVNVFRHDAAMLKEIKYGGWTLDRVEKEAERLNQLLDTAFVNSKLPDNPDYQKAENLLIEILKESITQ